MKTLARVVAVSFVFGLAAPGVGAVEVEHQPVGCVVADRFSQFDACFTPAGSVAKARLYFRLDSSPTWYYVDMKSAAPCWSGSLPKAKKSLVNQKLHYYIQVFDQSMAEGRSLEYTPNIVGAPGECGKEKLVAPLAAAGPAGVFPAVPAGFVASGLGATPFVLGGLGVAAAGGAALAVSGGDDPPPVSGPPPTPPTPPTPTTPITPPLPPPDPTLQVTCKPVPYSGPAPLKVDHWAYPTGGTGSYGYLWSFSGGAESTARVATHTYVNPGNYTASVKVTSGSQTASCDLWVTATSGSTVPVTTQWSGTFGGTVTSSPAGISCVYVDETESGTCSAGFGSGSTVVLTVACDDIFTVASFPSPSDCDSIVGSSCTLAPTAARTVEVSCDYFYTPAPPMAAAVSATVRTSMEALGARGRVMVDGVGLTPVEPGAIRQVSFSPRGEHLVEAVVDAGRSPGLWRFDLADAAVADGTLRVLSGEVVGISPGSVVFRITGREGERISFSFVTTRRSTPRQVTPRRR